MKKDYVWIYLCCLFIFITGCASGREGLQTRANVAQIERNSDTVESRDNITVITENEEKGYGNDINENIKEYEAKNNTAKERAKYLADSISVLDGINQANVVITGNTAIVGITLEIEMDDGKLISLKRDIEKEVKNLDSEIDHVAVTAAPDLVNRIIDMQDSKPEKEIENDALFRLVPII